MTRLSNFLLGSSASARTPKNLISSAVSITKLPAKVDTPPTTVKTSSCVTAGSSVMMSKPTFDAPPPTNDMVIAGQQPGSPFDAETAPRTAGASGGNDVSVCRPGEKIKFFEAY